MHKNHGNQVNHSNHRLPLCMLQAFRQHIEQKKLCKATDKILVAVSGGLDSMVLLHLLRLAGYSVGVAHANFQLRGKESDADEEFVKKFCHRWNLPFYGNRFETNNYATAHGVSTQMAARELRYPWFQEVLHKENYDWIATAHHANDSLETILLNLSKGAGMEGMMGVEAKNKNIIRPLLFATREEIENYAAATEIAWREDSSNSSDDYQRNFIRHQLVPLLKQINPSVEESVQRTITKLKGVKELAQIGIDQWKTQYQKIENGKIRLRKNGLKDHQHAEGILFALVKEYGFNLDQCADIIHSLHGQSGKKFSAPDYELVVDRDELILYKLFNETEVLIPDSEGIYQLGNLTLNVRFNSLLSISTNKNTACLDASKLPFPLKWRKWQEGDRFYPLGMKHQKKLSDFFIDEKMTLADKESATVIESNEQIIWVVGHRIDDRYKITDETLQSIVLDCEF